MAIRSLVTDPMLHVLMGAVLLAILLPVNEQGRPFADVLASAAVFVLFLINGMRIARGEIRAGLRNWRFLGALTLWVFGGMAFAGLALSFIGSMMLPPLIAVGFLYLGALPSTVQSAASYTALAGGNTGLSVIAAALLNILGVFLTVPIFLALGGTGEGLVGLETIQRIALILLLPFAIGQVIQNQTRNFIEEHRTRIAWADRLVIGLAVYVAFSGAVQQGIFARVDAPTWVGLGGLVFVFLTIGNGGAWLAGGFLGLPLRDRIAFLFAGAQKSAAIGVPLATILFVPAVAGFIVVPLLLYHLFQLIVAAPIADTLRRAE